MSTLELKAEIIENLSSIEDIAILEQIKQFYILKKRRTTMQRFLHQNNKKELIFQ